MFGDYWRLVRSPREFIESVATTSLTGPSLVVLLVGVVTALAAVVGGLVSTVATLQLQTGYGPGVGAGPGAAFLFSMVVGLLVNAVLGLCYGFVLWIVYAGAFYVLTLPFGGEGRFRDLLALTGWGFVPKLPGTALATVLWTGGVVWFAVLAGRHTDAAPASPLPRYLFVAGLLVGLPVTLWQTTIWIAAVERARTVTRRQASVAVGVPAGVTAFGILTTVVWMGVP